MINPDTINCDKCSSKDTRVVFYKTSRRIEYAYFICQDCNSMLFQQYELMIDIIRDINNAL